MVELKGKVAVVTGASAGIGAAIVEGLLELGMKVVGLARRKEKIEELGKGYEGNLFAIQADVAKEEDMIKALTWTRRHLGPIHVLINNAGVLYGSPIAEAETEQWRNMFNVNLIALTLFTKFTVKMMQDDKVDGIIVNMNSIEGHYRINLPGLGHHAVYSASKFGVTAFTESIRLELAKAGSKIRITSLSPGAVETEMSGSVDGDFPLLKSKDVADTVKYILTLPENVNVAELILRPVGETL